MLSASGTPLGHFICPQRVPAQLPNPVSLPSAVKLGSFVETRLLLVPRLALQHGPQFLNLGFLSFACHWQEAELARGAACFHPRRPSPCARARSGAQLSKCGAEASS